MNLQNPAALLQMMNLWNRFEHNHPKFPKFLKAVGKEGVKEGTVLEVKVTTPEGKEYCSNLRVTEEDLELVAQMRELMP